MKYVRCTVRDSRIRSEMSWSSTHMYENTGTLKPSCITVLSVLIMKIFKCYATETPLAVIKVENMVKNQDGGLKVLLFDL